MQASFSSLGMYSVAEAEIVVAEINGAGGYAAPQVWVPLRISVSHGAMKLHDGYEFIAVSGRLMVGGQLVARALPNPVGFTIHPRFNELKNQHHHLEFALDSARLAALERLRAGGDLKVRLEAELEVMQLRALNLNPQNQPMLETVWGQVQRHRLRLGVDVSIPKSVWIERVLPQVGYGLVHLIELPAIPVSAGEAMKHGFEALRQAGELHKTGHHSEAVGKCRAALEEFFEYPEVEDDAGVTRRVPTLKTSWETRLGKATYTWLNQTLAALKAGTNKPHHLASATYSQFDSQMIIMVTTAVVSYAARHLAEDRP